MNFIILSFIQYLYHNNIYFSFKPIFSFNIFPSKNFSYLFILSTIQKIKNGGHIVFDNSSHLNYAKLYLHSYVGKPTSQLQSLLKVLPTPHQQDFYSFYRKKGFFILNSDEIMFNETQNHDLNFIQDYQDILSFSYVYQFFKKNKHPNIQPFFQYYQSFLHSSIKTLFLLKKKFSFKKNIKYLYLIYYKKIIFLLLILKHFYKKFINFFNLKKN